MLDTTTVTENTVSPNHEFRLLTAEDLRALRKQAVFDKAAEYQNRFWDFAHALYKFDLFRDWQYDLNATQEGYCQSLTEWLVAYQSEIRVSPSWALYMAGLPGLHQSIQKLIGSDATLSNEVEQLVHNTDPSRIQVVQATVNKRIKIAQAVQVQRRVNPELVSKDDVEAAVQAVIEPLQVAQSAENRKEVEEYVNETKGIVHRTIHLSVAELEQHTLGKFEITELPKDAIIAVDIWYNPKKQAEYRAEMAAKAAGSPETSGEGSDSSSEPDQS